MNSQDNDLLLLESMLGIAVSRTAGVQVAVDKNLPVPFPKSIHYELYKNHIELHIESSTYRSLCEYLERTLPNNDIAKTEKRGFCEYAYVLNRRVEGWSNIEELGNAIIELRNIVEPVLMQYCEQIAENFELAKVLGDYLKHKKRPCHFISM